MGFQRMKLRVLKTPKFHILLMADWLSQFELIERSGDLISSEDLLGTPYVVSFFSSVLVPASVFNKIKRLKNCRNSSLANRFVSSQSRLIQGKGHMMIRRELLLQFDARI